MERLRKNSVSVLKKESADKCSPSSPGKYLLHQDCGSRVLEGGAEPVLGLKTIIFLKNLNFPGFTPHFRDWGGELAFPLPHNTSTPRSWLQDEEEVGDLSNLFQI